MPVPLPLPHQSLGILRHSSPLGSPCPPNLPPCGLGLTTGGSRLALPPSPRPKQRDGTRDHLSPGSCEHIFWARAARGALCSALTALFDRVRNRLQEPGLPVGTPQDPTPSLGGARREMGGVRAAAPNLVKLPREAPHLGTSAGAGGVKWAAAIAASLPGSPRAQDKALSSSHPV